MCVQCVHSGDRDAVGSRLWEHINRTSFSALMVNNALAVLCNETTADQLSLRRHGGWT